MTWDEFRAARLSLAEQKVGRRLRADVSAEDEAFAAAAAKIRKMA